MNQASNYSNSGVGVWYYAKMKENLTYRACLKLLAFINVGIMLASCESQARNYSNSEAGMWYHSKMKENLSWPEINEV